MLTFFWDAELAESYYFEYYDNTNKTMFLYSPVIPMRPSSLRKYVKVFPVIYRKYYQPGVLKELYGQRQPGYIWKVYGGIPLRMALVAALMITFIGVCGQYFWYYNIFGYYQNLNYALKI